ncbi:uncharacterized secreted protein [Aequorivita sublithincola DSM 14238]|uniref:Uncharacterized secreted protein n=1 Tax=Aequorivita sublithincola (strain DSM 14238 / LMG 21431 / ACAM 643 / 9-3) TaxID=746697 RepID=I3YZ55_AEQSU|nr:DUF1223 domain-containing protein [Aequorivita sublithincola]AFL82273.1 uncharacterized secreted protein [Aequorivita sublithincola DSM 14238]
MKSLAQLLIFPLLFGMCFFNNESDKSLGTVEKNTKISGNKPFAIVQLFTSQGCSSCPSADVLLEKVEKEYEGKNVFVLSYHVDYWNRLGWKDVFSKKDFSDMQYSYSGKFGGSNVYTPQAVVNGDVHFVGSSEAKMNGYLSKFLKLNAENTILLSNVKQNGDQITFNYKIEGTISGKDLKVALAIEKKETNVKRGENSGRKLSSVNIVVEQLEIPLTETEGRGSIIIPGLVENGDPLTLIGFTQSKNFDITAATQQKI